MSCACSWYRSVLSQCPWAACHYWISGFVQMWSIPCWESLSTIWPQRCYSKWDTDDQSLTIKGCQPCFLGGVRLCSGSRLVGTGSSVSLMIRQLYSEILWLYDDFLCLFIANEANYLPIAVGLNPDFVALPSPCWRWTTTVAVVSPRWSWRLFLGLPIVLPTIYRLLMSIGDGLLLGTRKWSCIAMISM